ncbi:MAG: leucine--tRNA ligase [Bacteroidales bacterium]
MEYNFKEVEKKWQQYWSENKTYQVDVDHSKPKYYVLDMFPYPSGAGLHVGHPLGYIATDIFTRYKRMNGFNVLHPMGFDAYGLPAEQYAIQTGKHPAKTTDENIKRYKEQLFKIGFSYDWDREIRTCDPGYYKWTQWAFIQMFKHWYNKKTNKAEPIENLVAEFEKNGNTGIEAACSEVPVFTPGEWKSMDEKDQQEILLNYRLAYLADAMVNWCPALGTVLANDEVNEGYSIRGGHPVEQKKMKQWLLRITAYAQRLLTGLDEIEWPESLKEIQKNWIGRSEGANMVFPVKDSDKSFVVFTTRPDTIFGVTFMVIAPESELASELTTPDRKTAVEKYIEESKKRSERERMADVKTVSGEFTGSFAKHPFTGDDLPVYVSDYVIAGYGTGAIMAVPAHDSRDFKFARHFHLPIIPVISVNNQDPGDPNTWDESYDSREGTMINSDFINGLHVEDAIRKVNDEIEKKGLGNRQINYRIHDAIFSRQRYWGEPFPVFYKDDIPYPLDEDKLPLELPEIETFLPTAEGDPPLGRAKNWQTEEGYPLELSTMPGFAGSSAYYLRYMDPHNNEALVSETANKYWKDVDLYVGGVEHATGHLIYSRFWNMFLYDIGIVIEKEPFKKLINQGMIQGRSNFVYRIKNTNTFVSVNLKKKYEVTPIHVDVNIVHNDILDIEAFKKWNPEYKTAEFILEEDGKYHCGWAIEKMSKSLYNVVNPDDIIEQYGADVLRMYEMFLGPVEQSKPWDTNGIDGVDKFLRKFWRLFHDNMNNLQVTDEEPTREELKVLHKTIKKIGKDIEKFSFNTSVSAFMICVNELNELKCNKRLVLEKLLVILSPFAPHITEELWHKLGNSGTVNDAKWPAYNENYLIEDTFTYPVSFNGKMRFKIELPADMPKEQVEKEVINHPGAEKWLENKTPKKIIVVPRRIINIVV